MTFCFVCDFCGYRVETAVRDPAPYCCHGLSPICGEDLETPMRRDWRVEGVGVGSGVRVSRTGTSLDQACLFLPDNDEFKGPDDPDGTAGMRRWREGHTPREDNPNPAWPGTVERKVF